MITRWTLLFGATVVIGLAAGWLNEQPVDRGSEESLPLVTGAAPQIDQLNPRHVDLKPLVDEKLSLRDRLFAAAAFAGNDVASLPARIDAVLSESFALRSQTTTALIEQWVREDPARAFRHFISKDDRRTAARVLGLWVKMDPDAAVAAVAGEKDDKPDLVRTVALGLADADPERAFELWLPVEDSSSAPIFREWAKVNPQRAAEEAKRIKNDSYERYARRAALAEWAKTDPVSAAAWVETRFGNHGDRSSYSSVVLGEWAKEDSLPALDFVADWPAGKIDNVSSVLVESLLRGRSPTEAISLVNGVESPTVRSFLTTQLATNLAGTAPEIAVELLGGASAVPEVAKSIFRKWANKDWDAAAAAAVELPSVEQRASAARGLLAALSSNAGGGAGVERWLAPLLDLATTDETDVALEPSIIEDMSSTDLQYLVERYGDRIGDSVNGAIRHFAEREPERAREIVDSLSDLENSLGERSVQELVMQWVRQDPMQAIAWVDSMPAGTQREVAYRNLGHNWTRIDPEGAETWLRSLPDSVERDLAVKEYVVVQSNRDHSTALELAQTIDQETARSGALTTVFKAWLQRDYYAARDAAATMKLPSGALSEITRLADEEEAWQRLRE